MANSIRKSAKLTKYGGGSKDHTPPVDFVRRACVFVPKIFRAKIFRKIYTYNMIISASISVASALKFRNTGKNDFPVLSVIVISVIEKHVVHAFLGYSLLTLILSVICTIAISESLFYIEPVKKRFDIFVVYIVIFLINFLIF